MQTLREGAGADSQLLLMFLSDGAPSDHAERACGAHGVQAWSTDEDALSLRNGKQRLKDCPTAQACRSDITRKVREECCRKIVHLGVGPVRYCSPRHRIQTGARATAWCLLGYAEASLSLSIFLSRQFT